MNVHITNWLDARKKATNAALHANEMLKLAEKDARLPASESLRQATAQDVIVGAIFWYLESDYGSPFWKRVEEVLSPYDQWKAFYAIDGCRYGLRGAFVEKL